MSCVKWKTSCVRICMCERINEDRRIFMYNMTYEEYEEEKDEDEL